MGVITQRRAMGAAMTGALIIGAVGITSLSVSGAVPVEATQPVTVPYGTLTINLAAENTYTLDYSDPDEATVTETIQVGNPCATIAPGSGGLIILEANPPSAEGDTVQVRDFALGVNTGGTSCGTSAAAVISGAERLEIELGPVLPADVYVESAELQISKNKKGDLKYGLDGGALGAEITIPASAQTDPVSVLVEPTIAAVGDLFTSITIASTSTKDNEGISIADGTSFDLVTLDDTFEVAVDCGEKVTEIGGDGEVAKSAVFLRGQNEAKGTTPTTCQDVGVVVEILPGTATFPGRVYWDNSFVGVGGAPQKVQGIVTIEWAPILTEGKTTAEINAILDREIDYDGPGAAGFTNTLWCVSFDNESSFTLPAYSGLGANRNGTPTDFTDDTAPWCLVSDERVLTNIDHDGDPLTASKPAIIQTETLAGKGDPWRL